MYTVRTIDTTVAGNRVSLGQAWRLVMPIAISAVGVNLRLSFGKDADEIAISAAIPTGAVFALLAAQADLASREVFVSWDAVPAGSFTLVCSTGFPLRIGG